MRAITLKYAMKRTTEKFENDTAEVEVEIGLNDSFEDAVLYAKTLCEEALQASLDEDICDGEAAVDEILVLLTTPAGRRALEILDEESAFA